MPITRVVTCQLVGNEHLGATEDRSDMECRAGRIERRPAKVDDPAAVPQLDVAAAEAGGLRFERERLEDGGKADLVGGR